MVLQDLSQTSAITKLEEENYYVIPNRKIDLYGKLEFSFP